MCRETFKRDLRDNISTRRIVCIWKELEEEAVEADTFTNFNTHLDRYIDRKHLETNRPITDKWD